MALKNPPIWNHELYGIQYDENDNLIESSIPAGHKLELRCKGVYKVVRIQPLRVPRVPLEIWRKHKHEISFDENGRPVSATINLQ